MPATKIQAEVEAEKGVDVVDTVRLLWRCRVAVTQRYICAVGTGQEDAVGAKHANAASRLRVIRAVLHRYESATDRIVTGAVSIRCRWRGVTLARCVSVEVVADQ